MAVQNIKGMRDHLPQAMLLRQHIINTLTAIFERHGYEPLSTPIVEYAETLDGKLGDDEKLIYRFEDHGGRKVALRYDQTVPLARIVAQYGNQLHLPWRRYAVGASYRGERPARGRYRELWQADIDIVGSTSPLADAETIAILAEALIALEFPSPSVLLGHRQIIGGIARMSGLDEAAAGGVYRAIDKLDKIGRDGVREELLRSGVAAAPAEQILDALLQEGENATILDVLEEALHNDDRALAAVSNLRAILAAVESVGVDPERVKITPRLARGLSYYTGSVFEAITPHWPEGSLSGGGRYDDLLGLFAGRSIPTVGLAFGIERLHDVMEDLSIGPRPSTTAQVFVTLFDSERISASLEAARDLRNTGLNAVIALEANGLGKQFKEADRKGIRYVVVLGPDELAQNQAVIKDLSNGEQQRVARSELAETLQKLV